MIFQIRTIEPAISDQVGVMVYEVLDHPEVVVFGKPPKVQRVTRHSWSFEVVSVATCINCRIRVDRGFASLSRLRYRVTLCERCYRSLRGS